MSSGSDLAKMVPGFEFLQNLMKGAGASLPGMGQWIAPTLDPQEIDKRIQELKTVQFWLEQNARLLATTIQALEVQRMTLATLQTMNLPMTDLREALKAKPPEPKSEPDPEPDPEPKAPVRKAPGRTTAGTATTPPAAAIDPMQWWSALTQQFTDIAAKAVQGSTADAARTPSSASAGPVVVPGAAAPAAKPAGRKRAR